jgi:CRISPR-associated protein Csc3
MSVNHPQKLVKLYRAFYRADKRHNPSARKTVQPVYNACEIICKFDSSVRSPETLISAIAGETDRLMRQIHAGSALGNWVISIPEQEKIAILEFAQYLVNEVFYGSFGGDVARFQGRQRGYLENSCDFIYRLMQDEENKLAAAK